MIKNINELQKELAEVFKGLKDDNLPPKRAAEMNNTAGKIINSIKIQLEYSNLRKEKPVIKFLDCK